MISLTNQLAEVLGRLLASVETPGDLTEDEHREVREDAHVVLVVWEHQRDRA